MTFILPFTKYNWILEKGIFYGRQTSMLCSESKILKIIYKLLCLVSWNVAKCSSLMLQVKVAISNNTKTTKADWFYFYQTVNKNSGALLESSNVV